MTLTAVAGRPGFYAAGKVLAHVGLSPRVATSMIRFVPAAHRPLLRAFAGHRLQTVDRIGLAYMVTHCGSTTARALHEWAEEATAPPSDTQPPETTATRSDPSADLEAIRTASALAHAAVDHAREAQASLSAAVESLAASQRSLRALLRDQPDSQTHAPQKGQRADDEGSPIA